MDPFAAEGPRVRVSTRVKEKEAEDLLEYLLGLVRARGLLNEPGRRTIEAPASSRKNTWRI
jgi:hypothetical protein